MTARIIDGKRIAADIRSEVKKEIEKGGHEYSIISLLIGRDDASKVFITQKERACKEVGINHHMRHLRKTSTLDMVLHEIRTISREKGVTGILVEQPLPANLNLSRIAHAIPPEMDVDGMNPINHGRLFHGLQCLAPSTPSAVIEILDREKIELKGTEVSIVSHSNIIGKPLALMLLHRNASLKIAHVFTKDLAAYTKDAEILITGAGVPNLITKDMILEGATVIDVSMNRVDGQLCGDTVFDEVREKAGAITPVPGGVGPVTVAMLLKNTLKAHDLQTSYLR